MFKKLSSSFVKKHIFGNLLVIIGSIALALGNAIFLIELNIVTGGLSGIGIIVQHFVSLVNPDIQIIDIIVFIMTWLLWIIGFKFLGKEFALKTLVSSIVYPIALAIALRFPFFTNLAKDIAYIDPTATELTTEVGRILLCGIFGGVAIGGSVALTFLGGGSTGGLDVLAFIVEKYTKLKQSIFFLIVDGSIVILGIFLIPNNVVNGLCGIIGTALSALVLDAIYISNQSCYIADIISDKWEEISNYAQKKLNRGTTIMHATGGYQGANRIILRIVFPKSQYHKLRQAISEIDPKAFITFTQTNAVFGEGFKENT